MKDEIERRWLVSNDLVLPGDVDWTEMFIIQTTLWNPNRVEGEIERIRSVQAPEGVHYTHTIKHSTGQRIHRLEDERTVTFAEYRKLLKRAHPDAMTIRKFRKVFEYAGRVFELDTVVDPPDLVVVECELPSVDAVVELPPWLPIVREITDEPGWTNTEIAMNKGYPQ